MWKARDTTGKSVIVGGTLLGLALGMLLSLTLAGRLPHVLVLSATLSPRHCVPWQQTFDAALLRAMEDLPGELRAAQKVLGSVTLNKVFLDTLYTAVAKNNPDLTCAVTFLRQQDLSIDPGIMLTHVLPRLYFAQRRTYGEMVQRGERI